MRVWLQDLTQEMMLFMLMRSQNYNDAYSMIRVAQGNPDLDAEESTNTSIGLVLSPIEGLIVTN